MDLQQLRYFQTVARLEHMSKAAQKLYVAQPSLSRAIARLEEELGAPLFDRLGRQIRLNQLGSAFLQHVDQALAELEEGKRKVADMSGREYGQIELAVLYTVGAQLLPELLSAFRKAHPFIQFHLFQNAAHIMINQLEKGEIDLCISSPQPDDPEIGWMPLRTEEIYLVVPPGHRLAERKSISLQEVKHEPFVSLKRDYGLRELTENFCRQAGFEPHTIFEGDESVMVRGLVAAGLGVAFMPALALQTAPEPLIPALHIADIVCQRTIGLAWIKTRYLGGAVRLFRQFVIEYFSRPEPAS
ncbi:LysR family transcriptional regulator [Ktedonosporobacter rubrisoli]|uniref:LysR family transcriptional regulator n=1 Tax=Ktedonosporobacter rubrisoli TaxID=2509675 RepID=A0A4P6JT61_KTERU|nr:LysR family transcriptional regulator [Ktedonosporobacter rubrisoli]QBD78614.1 LysR family transcriptional regulator [Ktedonosporobacter rubrisoli]